MSSPPLIATLNVGSTSLRVDWFEPRAGAYTHRDSLHRDRPLDQAAISADLAEQLGASGQLIHRIVHGGERLRAPCALSVETQGELERWSAVAPLHNPPALAMIDACLEAGIERGRQWLTFDTTLYHQMPRIARHYALPADLGLEVAPLRYGFHGLAHQSLYRQWRQADPSHSEAARVLSLQLGGGCSMTAWQGSRVVDTSMGFTPLEGMMMTTRSGDVDPGLVLYLISQAGYSTAEVDRLLNRDSGLKGMAGRGMRDLLLADDETARFAVELFCYRARKTLGSLLAVLGGVDAILFGGGIGEHAAAVRSAILQPLRGLGIAVDEARNAAATGPSAPCSIGAAGTDTTRAPAVWVIPVDEARQMLDETLPLIEASGLAAPPHEDA